MTRGPLAVLSPGGHHPLDFSSTDMWQCAGSLSKLRRLLQPQCPGISPGLYHLGLSDCPDRWSQSPAPPEAQLTHDANPTVRRLGVAQSFHPNCTGAIWLPKGLHVNRSTFLNVDFGQLFSGNTFWELRDYLPRNQGRGQISLWGRDSSLLHHWTASCTWGCSPVLTSQKENL